MEQTTAALLGRAGALAVASATAGLSLLLRALDLHADDEVIIPELGWVSVGGAAWANPATVIVAPVTQTLTPTWTQLQPLLTPRTRAVIIAHLRGMAAIDLPRIAAELAAAGSSHAGGAARRRSWGGRPRRCAPG